MLWECRADIQDDSVSHYRVTAWSMKAFLYLSSYLLAKVLSGDLSSKWDSGWSGLSMMDDSLFSNLISKSARCAASHRASLPDEFIQSNAALPEISHIFIWFLFYVLRVKKTCFFNSSSGRVIYLFIWLYLIHCIRVSVKLICTYSPLGGYMQKITKITHGKSMIEQPHGHKPRTTKNRHRCLRVRESSSKYFSLFLKLGSPGSIRYTVKYKWRCLRLRC